MQPYPYSQPVSAVAVTNPVQDLRRRFGGRTLAALVVLVLSLIFAVFSLFTPWWSETLSGTTSSAGVTLTVTVHGDLLPGQQCVRASASVVSISTICMGYSLISGAGGGTSKAGDVMGLANILMIIALMLLIVALVIFIIGIIRPALGAVAFTLGIVASVLLIVAPIYVFVTLTDALNASASASSSLLGMTIPLSYKGFFGSSPFDMTFTGVSMSGTLSYGGSIGWFLAFVTFILILVGSILVGSVMKNLRKMGNFHLLPTPTFASVQPPVQAHAVYQPAPAAPPSSTADAKSGEFATQPPSQNQEPATPAGPPASK